VVGREYADAAPVETKIVGALTCPVTKPPNVYANSAHNVKMAKELRLDAKAKPMTCTAKSLQFIARMVEASISNNADRGLFSEARIREWAENTMSLGLDKIASKKWSKERFEKSLHNLLQRADPEYKFSASVKAENMQEGKAPRLLIADGDDGQFMALIATSCMEDLLF
jgi:hypothetical protein